MKKKLFSRLYKAIIFLIFLFTGGNAFASHIVGMDLYYTWISGDDYKITLVAYGNCSSDTGPGSAYEDLPTATPTICIYKGTTYETSITLSIEAPSAGIEVTPVCAPDSLHTSCHSLTYSTPGIKKFTYSGTYTVPSHYSAWQFVFGGAMGASSAGRAAAITNITGPGSTITQLVDTLNNTIGDFHNSNPVLTVLPTPFYCLDGSDNYNPGAVDADGDSLRFQLVPGWNTPGDCDPLSTAVVSYVAGYSAIAPLHTSSFSFDPASGQMSFVPSTLQRGLVVYNVREYRHGASGDTLIGTSQREMTFTVLTCTGTTPTASIDSTSGDGTIDITDSTHFHICANSGPFSLSFDPSEVDTTGNTISVTATGLPTGATLTVTGDSTTSPHAVVSWTSDGVAYGYYNFYLTFTDNNCPLVGQQTIAYTIGIYPTPSITYSVSPGASCFDSATVTLIPGGLGKPWDIYLLSGGTVLYSFIHDSVNVSARVLPGTYTVEIFSGFSSLCSGLDTIQVNGPPLHGVGVITNPTYCGNNDGSIKISGLPLGESDSINYHFDSVAQPGLFELVGSDSSVTINNLCAGMYDNIVVSYKYCATPHIGPLVLVNPPYTTIRMTATNPTSCGFNDGTITLYGLGPDQEVSVNFSKNGVVQTAVVNYAGSDSSVTIPGLSAGTYDNIVVTTGGACEAINPSACTSNVLGPVTLTEPHILANFTDIIHKGCLGDTVYFSNLSTSPGAPLYYRWHFGDSTTDTVTDPIHVYANTNNATDTVILDISNHKCNDSISIPIKFDNFITASFTSTPDSFICQDSSVAFTNTSTGTDPTYTWYFGDGTTSTDASPVHIYPGYGSYEVMLIAANGVPCYDTATEVMTVDSNSIVSLHVTDSVFCQGQAITFAGIYSLSGISNFIWNFGDGIAHVNMNPILHTYDTTGFAVVTLKLNYRTCPDKAISDTILIIPSPVIDLGPDTAICPGSLVYPLFDKSNIEKTGATWLWSTGATTSAISITAPGLYYATVTVNGCSASDSVLVANDCYVDIPNVFTPNGDGVNDYFFPRQYLTRGLTSFSMEIYNRWGQLLFKTGELSGRGWDGNLNNTPQPEGVYVYIIDATFVDGQKEHKQGNITLLR